MDRPFVGREITPYGEPASAALIRAVDHRLQEGHVRDLLAAGRCRA